MFELEVSNRQSILPIDERRVRDAVAAVLAGERIHSATISIAIVDDATIRVVNARYLAHDYDTDVLSFLFERTDDGLEGEVVVSAETARRQAPSFGWSTDDELTLYLVHGTLHLLGYDDHEEEDAAQMRQREQHYLSILGSAWPDSEKRNSPND